MAVAIYDFRVAPLTYDFQNFLAAASLFFAKHGEPRFDLVLFRPFFRNIHDWEQRIHSSRTVESRFRNIIIQSALLAQCVKSIHVVTEGKDLLNVKVDYPLNYDFRCVDVTSPISQIPCNFIHVELQQTGSPGSPRIFDQANGSDFELPVGANPGRVVSLSLRGSPQKIGISSKVEDWKRLYDWLELRGYNPVVVPDFDDFFAARTYKNYHWSVNEAAAYDLQERLSVYRSSAFNVAAPGGWNGLLTYSSFPHLIVGALQGVDKATLSMLSRKGPRPFEQPYWYSQNQRYDWSSTDGILGERLIAVVERYLADCCTPH